MSRITRLTSAKGQREGDLRHHAPDTWKAVDWLRNHRDKFHGQVFEPVRLQVQVAQKYRQYVDIAEGPITMASMNVSHLEPDQRRLQWLTIG